MNLEHASNISFYIDGVTPSLKYPYQWPQTVKPLPSKCELWCWQKLATTLWLGRGKALPMALGFWTP